MRDASFEVSSLNFMASLMNHTACRNGVRLTDCPTQNTPNDPLWLLLRLSPDEKRAKYSAKTSDAQNIETDYERSLRAHYSELFSGGERRGRAIKFLFLRRRFGKSNLERKLISWNTESKKPCFPTLGRYLVILMIDSWCKHYQSVNGRITIWLQSRVLFGADMWFLMVLVYAVKESSQRPELQMKAFHVFCESKDLCC